MATETEKCETIISKEVGKHKLSLLKRKGEGCHSFIVSHSCEQTILSSFEFSVGTYFYAWEEIAKYSEAKACFYAVLATIENVLRCENQTS